MASSSLSVVINKPPPGFKWVLVCNDCTYCLCFDCLSRYIKNSPACLEILNKTQYHLVSSNGDYFRNHRELFRGIMTGGPFQGQVYICLYTPYLTYLDYCMIMQQVKYDGCIWITLECDTFRDYHYNWSGWFYLLFWQYCPRDSEFFNEVDQLGFKMWLHAEICEAGQHDAWFVFSLTHVNSWLIEASYPNDPEFNFKVKSEFYGRTCVPVEDLMTVMAGSPFFESFSGMPPFSDDHSSPPASHYYDSDASFDSIEEHNIINRMEA